MAAGYPCYCEKPMASWATSANYTTTLSLKISSGEHVDIASIMPQAPADFYSLVSAGQLTDITDLLNEYGQETIELMGDYINGMASKVSIYGAPCFRNYASCLYII